MVKCEKLYNWNGTFCGSKLCHMLPIKKYKWENVAL